MISFDFEFELASRLGKFPCLSLSEIDRVRRCFYDYDFFLSIFASLSIPEISLYLDLRDSYTVAFINHINSSK